MVRKKEQVSVETTHQDITDKGQPVAVIAGLTVAADQMVKIMQNDQALIPSEARFRNIFQSAAVSIWEEDFTEVMAALAELIAAGVTDMPQYLITHPGFVVRAVQSVRNLDVNAETLPLYRAGSKAELFASLDKMFVPESLKNQLTPIPCWMMWPAFWRDGRKLMESLS